jgi:hypothetical protein
MAGYGGVDSGCGKLVSLCNLDGITREEGSHIQEGYGLVQF